MRALTHADTFLCPHGGLIKPATPTSAKLAIGPQPVLLVHDLKHAAVQCPAGPGRCNRIGEITNPANLRTRVAGMEPVMEGATVMTDRGRAIPAPAPGPHSWRLGPAPSYSPPPPPVQCIGAEDGSKRPAKGLAPGVYLGGRQVHGVPGGTHQFLLLIPGSRTTIRDRVSFSRTIKGLTVAGHSTNQVNDVLELIDRKDFLIAKRNEPNDVSAVKEWLADPAGNLRWQTTVCRVADPSGLSVDEFIDRILKAYDHFNDNIARAAIEYPLLGGALVHLAPEYGKLLTAGRLGTSLGGPIGAAAAVLIAAAMILNVPKGRCFNSNSWTHGILNVARGGLPPGATDLKGLDLCFENSIPPYYFLDNAGRIQSAQRRRAYRSVAFEPARRLSETAAKVVKAVSDDPTIQNKAEVVLEDLRIMLLGGAPTLEAEPLNKDYLRGVWRFKLSLSVGASGIAGNQSPIESCLAGLTWGFYAEGISWLLADALVLVHGSKGHPRIFQLASSLGSDLAANRLPLTELPARLHEVMKTSAP